jgi:hypothetical protein
MSSCEGENIFVQNGTRGGVNRSHVLFDNQSTVNQIANPSLLANIRKAKNPITVHCNNGSSYTNLEGDLGGRTVYHNPYGIANVLSLKSTKAKHRVTYDSWDCDGVFKVHTEEGIVEFKPSEKGLHYHDTSEDSSNFECMLVNTVVMWMNSFPVKSGISENWSPREIVLRHKLDAKMHCKVPFGAYCEVHVDPDITNTMWGICLGPTGNMQGSYKFLSLSTGKKVTRRKFTEMPMTDSVIKMVDSLGKKKRCKNGLSFKNRKGEEYTFDNDDEYEMIAEVKIPAPFPDIAAAEAPGILTEREEIMGVNEVIQSERGPSDKERAMLVVANSGIDFSAPPEARPTKRERIEILDDEDNDILDQHINERVSNNNMKINCQKSKKMRKMTCHQKRQ